MSRTDSADRVNRRIVIGAGRSIVLYAWSAREEPRIRNLVCVDGANAVLWRADLPASDQPDCFVRIERGRDTIVADTWRGMRLYLSEGTGVPLLDAPVGDTAPL